MTPKEKAIELLDKFIEVEYLKDYDGMNLVLAKQCALIAVDEIIEECGNWTGGTNDGWDIKRFDYWQEVKIEIEKL